MAESRVLVTGCGGVGVGRATAVALKARGHTVIATARDGSTIDDLDADLRLELDVTDPGSIERALEAAGPVTALVNNAARGASAPAEHWPAEVVRHMCELYIVGPLLLAQGVIPGMRQRGHGTIVNVTSAAGHAGVPLTAGYAAGKAGMAMLTEVMALELRGFGIRVCTVVPGNTRSEMHLSVQRFGFEDPPYQPLFDGLAASRERRGTAAQTGPEVLAMEIARLIEGPVSDVHHTAQADAAELLELHRTLPWPDYARFSLDRYMGVENGWDIEPSEGSPTESTAE